MMNDLTIGIVGLGMIGNSTAVLCTLHGYKTICYVRNEAKIPQYKAGFDKMYDELIAQGNQFFIRLIGRNQNRVHSSTSGNRYHILPQNKKSV